MNTSPAIEGSRSVDTLAPEEGSVRSWGLILICLVASLGGLLFGFDTAVISGTVQQVTTLYGLSSLMEGWFTSSALVGCILGAPIAGFTGDWFGRKPPLIVAAAFFFVSAMYSMVPPTFGVLVVARLIGGIGVGMASVLAPMYISEFAPPKWRGRLVAFYQLSIVVGILLAYYSNWFLLKVAQTPPGWLSAQPWCNHVFVQQYWRGMFGAELIPAGLFLLLLWLVPESPRWLVQAGKETQALSVLSRIGGPALANQELDEIRAGLSRETSSWRELLQPGIRTALLVGIMLSVFGQFSGVNIIIYYGPKILATAGFQAAGALLGQVGFGFINLIFTILALLVIDKWGRRPLLIGGMGIVTLSLAITGGLFFFGQHGNGAGVTGFSPTVALWIGVMICIYVACIALSICAVIWVLTPEIFPNRVRGRGTSIATFANWATNAFSALLFPWYVATLGMHAFFVATAFICAAATLFFWKFVPETKGRSLEEIEKLWGKAETSQRNP
jgi:SP family arabinose:H+ symporter-like MFS transporter